MLPRTRPPCPRQRLFAFRERLQARDRLFKWAIAGITTSALLGLLLGTPEGRRLAWSVPVRVQWAASRAVGLEPSREQVDADRRSQRALGIAQARRNLARAYAQADPGMQQFLSAVGMGPETALLRWGNFDRTLMLSSYVFEPDDTGRSYRLRPNTRSYWLRQLTLPGGVDGLLLVPDTDEVRQAIAHTNAIPVPESVQNTNSWGCRGPEPDPNARVRGLVLGDSYMQGMFIGDDETPPAQLEAYLRRRWNLSVSILNTGHLGYSPEQYYFTLKAYGDRFRPHFVVVSLFANDFGDASKTVRGEVDWDEAAYWLGEIQQYCRSRNILSLVVPIPLESQITAGRNADWYPGHVSRICQSSGLRYLDPTDDLVDEHLRLVREGVRRGRRPAYCPLFNGQYGDGHFSPRGAAAWAEAVGRRVALLFDPEAAQSASKTRAN